MRLNCPEPVTPSLEFQMSLNASELTASSQLMPQSVSVLCEQHFQDRAQRMNSGHCHTCSTFFGSHYAVWQPHTPAPLVSHTASSQVFSTHTRSSYHPLKTFQCFLSYFRRIRSAAHACHLPWLLVYCHTDSLSLLSSV